MRVEVPGSGCVLEGVIDGDTAAPRAIAVLGHPLPTAGGTMHTKVMFHTAKALARIGCPVLRFNFRGVDEAREDFQNALTFMSGRYPDALHFWAGGMSFGSWIGMTEGVRTPRVSALVGIAPPVNKYDYSSLVEAAKPTFLIHGERDELVPVKEVRRFYGQLTEPKELVVIEDANHLFDGKASEVGDAIEDLLQDYDG